jgi:hypothetical protein
VPACLVLRNAQLIFSIDELVVAYLMNSSLLMHSEGSLPRSVDRHLRHTNAELYVVHTACVPIMPVLYVYVCRVH